MATPRPFEYLCQNIGVSENHFFLDEGAVTLSRGLGVLGGQMAGLYGGTIFGGCETLGGSGRASNPKVPFFGGFSTHLRQLRGYSALTDFIKHQSRGAV